MVVLPGLDPADGRHLVRLARAAPEAAARAALRGAVVDQHAVAELVLGAADDEVEGVLAESELLPERQPM